LSVPNKSPFIFGSSWVYDLDNDSDNNRSYPAVSRRFLSTGRRRGWKGDDDKKKKKNFAKEFIEPAARGELKEKHSSGIPKLAVKKSKGHGLKGGGDDFDDIDIDDIDIDDIDIDELGDDDLYVPSDFSGLEEEEEGEDLVATISRDVAAAQSDQMATQKPARGGTGSGVGGGSGGGSTPDVRPERYYRTKNNDFVVQYYPHPNKDPEYWREEDYDDDEKLKRQAYDSIESMIKEKGIDLDNIENLDLDSLDDLFGDKESDCEQLDAGDADKEGAENEGKQEKALEARDSTGQDERVNSFASSYEDRSFDDDEHCDHDLNDDDSLWYNPISHSLPYAVPASRHIWASVENEPGEYEVRMFNLHPESKREPKPYVPRDRANPPLEFVQNNMRFLFVTGLPPALSEEGMTHVNKKPLNTLQQQEVSKAVTRLLGVTSQQVFAANETSAFVGFKTPPEREAILKRGLKEKILKRPISLSEYTPSSADDAYSFVKEAAPGTILKLDNVPPGKFSRATLARELFPADSTLGITYKISAKDVVFPSPTTAIIRFESAEHAKSALSSENVEARLKELGEYPVQLFRAKRELLHVRMAGPAKNREIRAMGPRLIVDGDMPSKNFFISHAGSIMLRNVDHASVTKESITELFQPFSSLIRDVNGSVEFVTCLDGQPTDRVYVGFDRLGEAEAALRALNGQARIGDSVVKMKLVRDRKMPGLPAREQRPERTEEEILKNLNDWEQYVDPQDITYLEENGVPKYVIAETLRGIRYQNRSFGPLDWAMREEKLEPEKASGDDYRELVQLYISTLKECIATPEKPGEMYEALHFPGEPIDLSIFEREKKRQVELTKKREG
jgi:hypothetical protein